MWHQYKQQFAVIKGFDKKGIFVEYVPDKKGRHAKLSGEVHNWRVCVFEKIRYESKYKMIFKSEPLNTKIFRVYNFGFLFGYSNDLNGSETVAFINEEESSSKEIDGTPYWPERVFVSFC